MIKFRKKPVIIEAVQFTGTGDSCSEVETFLGGPYSSNHKWKDTTYEGGFIKTLEGDHEFKKNDWIIKGVKGEFYPCKPDIFDQTYEIVLND
jgi:hypothetical protein